jgi:hypothetical protein
MLQVALDPDGRGFGIFGEPAFAHPFTGPACSRLVKVGIAALVADGQDGKVS